MKKILLSAVFSICAVGSVWAADRFVTFTPQGSAFCLTDQKGTIQYDQNDWKGVHIAIDNLKKDLEKVLETIVSIHPYEEPVIDVVPMYSYKDFISSST